MNNRKPMLAGKADQAKDNTMQRKYDHLQRMGHRATLGIEEGRVYVFPKIDGTNASVWYEDGQVMCGSRNRVLSAESDNAGFYAWVHSDDPVAYSLRTLAEVYKNNVFYGEWLVPHTLKTYAQDAWRKFYIFDMFRNVEGELRGYRPFEDYKPILRTYDQDYIEPIAIYTNPTGAQLKAETENNDFLITDGLGEGVVIKNYEWRKQGSHGRVWGKFVRSEFKSSHRRMMGTSEKQGANEVERQIAEAFVTETLVRKTLAKTLLDVSDSEPQGNMMEHEELIANYRGRIIPQLLGRVWNDLIEEEMTTILKKFKKPTIDFARLQALTTMQIKTLVPELF